MNDAMLQEGWSQITPFADDPKRKGLISEWHAPMIFEGEMKSKDDGSRIFEGIIQRSNVRNKNLRIYPKHILERETNKMITLIKENGGILGELDHPETININMQKTCQRLDKLRIESDGGIAGRITMLPSLPMGAAAIGCADALNGRVGQSSRGGGTLFKKGEDTMVGEDYLMKTYDVVHDPSTHGAYTTQVDESIIREFLEYSQRSHGPCATGFAKLVDQFLGLPS